jgi:hypothetical protein
LHPAKPAQFEPDASSMALPSAQHPNADMVVPAFPAHLKLLVWYTAPFEAAPLGE